ncbi:glycosyltransferase family 2 protein [Paenibacillus tarimensis]
MPRKSRRGTGKGSKRKSPPSRVKESAGEKAAENPLVSVIIPAANEKRTIAAVIREARRVHPQTEVLVIANGSTDGTPSISRKMGARVIQYAERLGHDVGRAVGALHARGSILLFTDGDIVVRAGELHPFVRAVQQGVDLALNDYSGPTNTQEVHSVVLAKHVLNQALFRADLKGASMTAVPHAISRRFMEKIGAEALAVPPLAHAMAVAKGLKVQLVHNVPVGQRNPLRRHIKPDPLEGLIVGDHLEALGWLFQSTNARGTFPDLGRLRDSVG